MGSYLRVKICGVTNEVDAIQAAELGADWIGLNFFKVSPRYIAQAKAESIVRNLPPFVEPVGIFVSRQLQPVFEITDLVGLRMIQLHSADGGVVLDQRTAVRLIQPFSVSEKNDLGGIGTYLERCRREGGKYPAAIIVDARVPGQFGGTGRTVPWELLADFQLEIPLILAGGLTPENVAEAVRIVRPYGVDVASGVETSPGHKDVDKMKRFIENAREAAERWDVRSPSAGQ
jgi:phosphoribosylanthranilate isomerase